VAGRTRLGQFGALALLASAMLLASPSAGYELQPLPPQPVDLEWPTRAWPEGPLPEDLDREVFEASVEQLFSANGRAGYADTRALLVIQSGRLVYERYAEGFGPGSRFQSWSMAKSITNAFAGVLVRQGSIEVDAPVAVAAWAEPADPRGALTLRHLLHMSSGLDNADGFGEDVDLTFAFISRMLFGEGALAPGDYAANVPLVHPIGRHWAYSSGTSILVAKICGEQIGGGSAGTKAFLDRELFHPIGVTSAQPEFAASGEFLGGVFVHATARDWARFGYLYLRDGVWDGRRVLPDGWVDFSRTPNPAENNRIYGAHFWVNADPAEDAKQWKPLPGAPPSVFLAEGASFQMVAIAPTKDLVAVRLGTDQGTPFPQIKEPFGPLISAFPDRP
jgi:CubicO group peptidase (beta-lactamase class C family)